MLYPIPLRLTPVVFVHGWALSFCFSLPVSFVWIPHEGEKLRACGRVWSWDCLSKSHKLLGASVFIYKNREVIEYVCHENRRRKGKARGDKGDRRE